MVASQKASINQESGHAAEEDEVHKKDASVRAGRSIFRGLQQTKDNGMKSIQKKVADSNSRIKLAQSGGNLLTVFTASEYPVGFVVPEISPGNFIKVAYPLPKPQTLKAIKVKNRWWVAPPHLEEECAAGQSHATDFGGRGFFLPASPKHEPEMEENPTYLSYVDRQPTDVLMKVPSLMEYKMKMIEERGKMGHRGASSLLSSGNLAEGMSSSSQINGLASLSRAGSNSSMMSSMDDTEGSQTARGRIESLPPRPDSDCSMISTTSTAYGGEGGGKRRKNKKRFSMAPRRKSMSVGDASIDSDGQKSNASLSLRNSLEMVASTAFDDERDDVEEDASQTMAEKAIAEAVKNSMRPVVSPVSKLKLSREKFENCKDDSSKFMSKVLEYLDNERPTDFQRKFRNFDVQYDLAEDVHTMRLEAEHERKQQHQDSFYASHWYTALLAMVMKGNREITSHEKLLLHYVKDMIDCGHAFQRPMLYSMAMALEPKEMKSDLGVNKIITFLRNITAISVEEWDEFLRLNDLPKFDESKKKDKKDNQSGGGQRRSVLMKQRIESKSKQKRKQHANRKGLKMMGAVIEDVDSDEANLESHVDSEDSNRDDDW
jgi:hypothetical protein